MIFAQPIGSEFLVNTTTQGNQGFSAVARLSDGRFVVTWEDDSRISATSQVVRAQLFNSDGSKSGDEFFMPSSEDGFQYAPDITTLPNGQFAIVWSVSDGEFIWAQLFNSDGSRATSEFPVNSSLLRGSYTLPAVVTLSDESFVVTWSMPGDTSRGGIYAQVFNADGTKAGGEFLVNTTTLYSQFDPAISALSHGGFVIAWTDSSQTENDTSALDIRAQVFSSDGVKLGTEFLANTTTVDRQIAAATTALSDGRFVIAWTDYSQIGGDTFGSSIRAQVFNPDGSKSGEEVQVNTTLHGIQGFAKITSLNEGRFLVIWTDRGQSGIGPDPESAEVRAQLFNSEGIRLGNEITVNTTTQGDQFGDGITALTDMRVVITWTDRSYTGDDTSGSAIRAQIFELNLPTIGTPVLSGTPRQSETLTVDASALADPNGLGDSGFTYQWLRDGAEIEGATEISYTLRQADVGQAVSVRVSYTDAIGVAESVTSNATQAIENVNDPLTGAPVISGTPAIRETLTARTDALVDPDGLGTFSYQWLRNGVEIAGATGADYRLTRLDLGQAITVRVDVTDGFGAEETASSAPVTPGLGTPGWTVTTNGATTSEAGQTVTLQFALNAAPTADVVLTLAVDDATEATLDTTTLTFTPQNWDVLQPVIVMGLDDFDDDGDTSFAVTGQVQSLDLAYGSAGFTPVSLVNLDDSNDADIQFYGTNAPDTASGLNGDDQLYGAGGRDELRGGRGDDRLYGEQDDDLLFGDLGDDRLNGGYGDDTLHGGDGADTLNGAEGDDFLFGGDSVADLRDVIYGGFGDDYLDGGHGNDELNGGEDNDTLLGGFGSDTLVGNSGHDLIAGGAGSDLMFGGPGNDTLNGGWGYDRLNGGEGADRFFHVGVPDHASDWIQDYDAAEGDVLVFGQPGATRDQFQINIANTPSAGSGNIAEAFVIYRPSGQIMWALVDGDGQSSINLQLGSGVFDLIA